MRGSLTIGVGIAVVVLIIAGYLAVQHSGQQSSVFNEDELSATIFHEPRHFPQITLTDDQINVFDNAALDNHWTLMFFGFTNCGGICPTTLAELAQVFHQNPDLVSRLQLQVVFVTVDPERDTPVQLRSYLNSFNPAFIGVTGEANSLAKLRRQLGILAMERESTSSQSNTADNIDHSGTILLINPQGQYVGVFSMPHSAATISHDLERFADMAQP